MNTKKEEFLIYINKCGYDWKNRATYEFIFTDDLEQEIGDPTWGEKPASNSEIINAPDSTCVTSVGSLKLDSIDFEIIQESQVFSVDNAQEGIVALAWEDDEVEDDVERLIFRYGESKKAIMTKLFNRELVLKFE